METRFVAAVCRDILVALQTKYILRGLVETAMAGITIFFFLPMRLRHRSGHQNQCLEIATAGVQLAGWSSKQDEQDHAKSHASNTKYLAARFVVNTTALDIPMAALRQG